MSDEKGNIFRENKLLWKLVNASYDGMFLTDSTGMVVYCNDSYQRISGLNRENILNRQISDLVNDRIIPDAVTPDVIAQKKPLTKVINYFHGVSALVTGTPIFDGQELVWVLSNVRDITQLNQLKEQVGEYSRRLRQAERAARDDNKFLAVSKEMENIVKTASRVASFSSPVLIQGESGVGKDMLARYIHDCSDVSENRPFVQINCSAIPETLLESELFGYESGAFTGASAQNKGAFERADGGTLFLDEIGDAPLPVQVKLLRALEEREIRRVGGQQAFKVDVRVVSATHRDLHERVAEGLFREDLLYRVNVVNITVPPLRRRLADIRPLANRFIAQAAEAHHRTVARVAESFYQALERYEWPGNIRQLRNVVEAAVLLCTGPELTAQSVSLPAAPPRAEDGGESFELPEGMTLEQLERAVLMKTLQRYQGNRTLTAERLGLSRRTIQRKVKEHGLSL